MSVTRDHLGSVEATSAPSGYFQNRMNFDAWGNRQNESWTRGTPAISSTTKQGYTGHEQLDSHKLVHMQGRVYDPALGRFLSADLLVQSPHSTQSFNRYSYVSNNPLSRIDPTGYAEEGSNGRSGDGTDYSDKGDEIVVTGTRDSCASGATCLTGGEADSYLRDMLAMQTSSLGSLMGVPNMNFGSVQEIKTFLEEKAVKQSDGSYVLQLEDGPAVIRLGAGDKNGKGVGLEPNKGAGSRIDRALDYIKSHLSEKRWGDGKCARNIRLGMNDAGIPVQRIASPGSAKDFGSSYEKAGFSKVDLSTGYQPTKGDVAIFGAIPGHPDGHIAIFDGKRWYSDFEQTDMYANRQYKAYEKTQDNHEIYRY